MSKIQKTKDRLRTIPADFTWEELVTVLTHVGYQLENGSGSRRCFVHQVSGHRMRLHEPHPANIVKKYALREVLDQLESRGLL